MSGGLKLEELQVYIVAMEIGEIVWKIVNKWDFFNKDTLGKQFCKAADSIGFKISEGYGRYFYKENKNFCYYSRGSAFETLTAKVKAQQRNLLSVEEEIKLRSKLEFYFKLINPYINSIGSVGDKPHD